MTGKELKDLMERHLAAFLREARDAGTNLDAVLYATQISDPVDENDIFGLLSGGAGADNTHQVLHEANQHIVAALIPLCAEAGEDEEEDGPTGMVH